MMDRRPSWLPAWVWVAAVLLLALAFYTTWQTRRIRIDLAQEQAVMDQLKAREHHLLSEREKMRRIQTVLSDSTTREVQLHPLSNPSRFPVMRAYWNPKHGIVLAGEEIPRPSRGRVYQLWIVPGKNGPFIAAVFQPAADGTLLEAFALETAAEPDLLSTLRNAEELFVTEEEAGGAPQPTGDPIWAGRIR